MTFINLRVSPLILQKLLEKHQVCFEEIEQCFLNREKGFLYDIRLDHKTNPPTQWFIAETDCGRTLKIVFIKLFNGMYEIKTAYEPNKTEVRIYENKA